MFILFFMNRDKTKKFVTISLISATFASLVVAYIMSQNLGTDISKTRFKLTKDYKAIKDVDFKYDPTKGARVYNQLCAKCHRADGMASDNYPGIKNSPYIQGVPKKLIKITIYGLKGKLKRGEKTYNGIMPGFKNIPHEDLAQALSFVRKTFAQEAEIPTIEIIKGKIDFIEQSKPFEYKDL